MEQSQQQQAAAAKHSQQQHAPVRQFDVAPAPARRRRRRVAPKEDRYAALMIPSVPVYSQLLSFERRVDAVIARRHGTVQESMRRNKTETSTLRIFVFSTATTTSTSTTTTTAAADEREEGGENGAGSGGDGNAGDTWTLHIQGRLLGSSDDAPLSDHLSREPALSSFIKRLEVDIGDENAAAGPSYPGGAGKVTWENTLQSRPCHGFEIKRHGVGCDVPITIRLEPNQVPERFRVSPEVAAVTGRDEDTKAHIIASLWEYIKAEDLQSDSDAGMIVCNTKLREIFGAPELKLSTLPELLTKHLSRLPPIEMKYVVPGPNSSRLTPSKRQRRNNDGEDDGTEVATAAAAAGLAVEHGDDKEADENATEAHCYDITVSLPQRGSTECQAFLDRYVPETAISNIDKELREIIAKMNEHKRRRDFFLGFSESPHEFIRQLTLSQARDLQILNSQSTREVDARRKSDFYRRKWVTDAALRFLHRQKANPDSDMPM